jgi:ATP-dependent helicase/nuclease subunit B
MTSTVRKAYKAEMGSILDEEIGAHLRGGGAVIAASDRAARAIRSAFDRARRAEGLQAWPTPSISSWSAFVHEIWQDRSDGSLLPLSPIQERSLWEQVIAASRHPVSLLEPSRRRVAAMAMRSHALLCSYAPRYLHPGHRQSWDQDSASFSAWLTAFDELCARNGVISAARLAHEAVPLLQANLQTRPPLLVTGFDRLLPFHSALLDAWGAWRQAHPSIQPADIHSCAAADPQSEIAACARWSRRHIAHTPGIRILIITPDVHGIRGDLERALYHEAAFEPNLSFEFSLGVPLIQTGPARSADMLLRWLDSDLAENELDWVFSSAYTTASATEAAGLLAGMRTLRRCGLQRTHWSLTTFLAQNARAKWPPSFTNRLRTAQTRLLAEAARTQNPAQWAELASELLKNIGWPGGSPSGSAEFQAIEASQSALESCGTLGFDGRRITWCEFLGELRVTLEESIFSRESEDAQILITGPAESAGITALAIWFLGADEDAWPAHGNLDPLIPPEIQRAAAMPHASPHDDWNLGLAITKRLVASAPEVFFSYPKQRDGVEMRASQLAASLVGSPQSIPSALLPSPSAQPLTVPIEDSAAIPFPPPSAHPGSIPGPVELKGGAYLLTAQSQCPFKAFATYRLDAKGWDAAEPGLTPPERGKLLHSAMRSIWSGPPRGILTAKELHAIPDLEAFAREHVQLTLRGELPPRALDAMPAQYIELEQVRLTRLIAEWLEYEKSRNEFEVIQTEEKRAQTFAGVSLTIRFDRLDRLNDGTVLVVDYKTGTVSPSAWDLPRPDDVQLPLYAGFGLDPQTEPVGGLVFAQVRPGKMCFAGRVADARATLRPGLNANSSLVKDSLTLDHLLDWRDAIEQLARDFIAGRSDVDPRDPAKTCSRCDLHALCRIRERETCVDEDGDEDLE